METEQIIRLKGSRSADVEGAVASNDFLMRNLSRIEIYLENFKYRKNKSYKKIAENMNDYFIIELICALSREYGNKNFLYCFKDYNKCPLDNVWAKMRLKIR